MARPSWSNPSRADGSGTSLAWSHTAEAGKDIRVQVVTEQSHPPTSLVYAGGGTVTTLVDCPISGFGLSKRWMVFLVQGAAPGSALLTYTPSASCSYISVSAFNVEGGGATAILPGAYGVVFDATATRDAYGWDQDGLIIATVFTPNPAVGFTITEGVNITSGGGMTVNAIDATDADQPIQFNRLSGSGFIYCAYMIPPASQPKTSGTFQFVPTGGINASGLSAGQSVFGGLPYGNAYIARRLGNIIATPGTWRSWQANSNRPPGSGNIAEIELMRGGDERSGDPQPTGIKLTISGTDMTSTPGDGDGIDFENYRYDRLSLEVRCLAGTLPADFCVRASFLRECGVANEHIHGGGIQTFGPTSVGSADIAPLHPKAANWSSDASNKSLIGIPGRFTEFVVAHQDQTDIDMDLFYTLNGALQDGSGGVDTTATLSTTSIGASLARWRGSLPVVPGDFIAHTARLNAPGFVLRQAAGGVFIPTTPGEQLISGHDSSGFSIGHPAYAATANSSGELGSTIEQGATSDEAKLLLIVPPLTALAGPLRLRGMIDSLDGVAPGSGNSLQQDLRVNGATAASIVLAGAGSGPGVTTGSVAADEALVEGDTFGTIWTPTGLPLSGRQFWSFAVVIAHVRGVIGPHQFIKFPITIPT